MRILAIESSCDETASAVITEKDNHPVFLSSIVSSQIDIHKAFGGVVPEVAARAHIENILPVINEALNKAGSDIKDIDYLAITNGPGLIGSLVVGVETVKAISVATGIPVIPVNHLEGHIYAAFSSETPSFPVLTLLVSGGNTLFILMNDHLNYKVVGQTIDDAAGEAFDKGAKILGLGYPGGPIISTLAKRGNSSAYRLPVIDLTPRPVRNSEGFMESSEPSLDFSFSGLKTALINTVKGKGRITEKDKANFCASYQEAIVKTLIQNSLRAIKKYKPRTFVLAGGVAANRMLREELGKAIKKTSPHTTYLIPPTDLCGDNAAMIGIAAYYKITHSPQISHLKPSFVAEPNLKIA